MPFTEETGTRKLAAIMFTDIKGFSRKMGENETVAMALLRAHDAMMHELVAKHGGTVIKSIGDSFMVDFSSAVNAVKCAVEAQQIFWYYNKGKSELEKIEIRVGIHLGDVITDGKDIYGDGVNIASRIETITQPNRICISQDIYNQVKNKMPLQVHSLGPVEFKNIAEPIEVFEILIDSIPDLARPSQTSVPARAQKKLEAETAREAEEAKRIEEVKQKVDEDALKVDQEQQRVIQRYYAAAEECFQRGDLDEAERKIGEIFKLVALHAGAQLLQMKIEETRFRKAEEERIRRSEEERRVTLEREQKIDKLLGEARHALENASYEEGLAAVRAILELSPEHERARAMEKEFLDAIALQAELAQEEQAAAAEPAEEETPRPKTVLKAAPSGRVRAPQRKQLQTVAVISLVAAVAVVVLIIALPSLQGVLFPLRTSVAVLPFPTASADPESASLGPAVAALAADDLGRIDQLKSIAPVSGTMVRRAAGSLEELADELQVGFVLRGDVSEQENGLLIRVTLQNIEKGLPVLSRSYTVALAELNLFRALLVKDVLQAMELDLPVPPMGSLTANGQAIRAYLNGIAGLATADSARIRAAADDFRLALAADSQMAEAAAGLGEASLRLYRMGGETDRGLLRDAQEFSQMALRIRPDIPQAYQTLGGVLRYRQKLTDARQALEHALELQPNAADARRQLALLNLMEGEYGAALQEADRAVRLDPRNPFSHEVMGNVHHLATRYEAALEAYERALTLGSSDSLLTMRYRMSAWIATGRGESAVAYAKRLADRFPGDYRVLYWAGQSVQLSGRALESQKMLDSADAQSSAVLARDPSNLDARLFRALILSRKGDFADAVAELAAAEQLAPGSALVLYRRANVLWIQNKKPEALQVLASAVSREFILPEVLGADFVYLAKEPEYAETVTVLQQNP